MKYYHIHRGTKESTLETNFDINFPLFLSKKDSYWYNIEKEIGKSHYDGYIIYEVIIPKNMFTTSFNSKDYKIVKIDKNNIKTYINLKNKYEGHSKFINEMRKRKIIGIDATDDIILKYKEKSKFLDQEGYVFDFRKFKPKIKKVEVYQTSGILKEYFRLKYKYKNLYK